MGTNLLQDSIISLLGSYWLPFNIDTIIIERTEKKKLLQNSFSIYRLPFNTGTALLVNQG